MANGEIVSGQQRGWTLLEKLGEGDAGEVYLVESLFDQQRAILKRPHRSAFTSEINRQASQIAVEAEILRGLRGVNLPVDWPSPSESFQLRVPMLLDRSKPGTEFSDRFFIIIELASGDSLSSLTRIARFGDPYLEAEDALARPYHQSIQESGQIPNLVILRCLAGVLELFQHIHNSRIEQNNGAASGLIWNDIKLDHLFWDPVGCCLTIIDWGNGQFLDLDGTTPDFRYTRASDYGQYVHAMGVFLANHAPDLFEGLQWSDQPIPTFELIDRIPEIKNRVSELLSEELRALSAIRQKESNLVLTSYPKPDQWIELQQIHQQVLRFGEIPDYAGAQKFCLHLAASLAEEHQIQSFCELCAQACRLPEAEVETWNFLEYLGGIASQVAQQADSEKLFPAIVKGILAVIQRDWPTTLWIILAAVGEKQEPPWVHDLACQVRKMQFGIPSDTPTPLMAVKRSLHALQSAAKLQEDIRARTTDDLDVTGEPSSERSIPELIELLRTIVECWTAFDPDPPDSGVEYSDIERLLIDIGTLHPASLESISRALEQPKAQIRLVMEAWGRKEFDAARRGLRYAFLWDPDRRRLFQADLAIQAATAWLAALSKRPRRDLTLLESITPLELEGRELRNQVGSARWLDLILDALTRLRKGANPADLVYEKPELKSEIPWLSDLEPPRPTKGLSGETVRLERQSLPTGGERTVRGIQEARLGAGTEFVLDEPLDTWIAEARGSSARVFAGSLRTPVQGNKSCAIKVMRSDRVDYGLPLFREETQILSLMRDVQGITPLLECGFIQLDPGQELPSDARHISAEELSGTVLRYAPEEVLGFLGELEKKSHAGWLPYLAVEKYLQSDNLIQYCDTGHNHGRFLPLDALLSMAIQICDILEIAHARNIVYRDHKILHYYWLEPHNGIFIIDWNVAKRHPHGLSAEEKQFDLVQFGARALHHIFTGRPAPGALPLGPTRPDEIEAAAHTYKPQWTYDDLRLPTVLKEILEKILAGGYTQVRSLRYDLFQVYQQLSITNI